MCRKLCPRCKGTGEFAEVDKVLAFLSLGLTALIDKMIKETCKVCRGSGRI